MRRKFYLNKRDGKLMGVCAGLADYTGFDALWIRIAVALLVLAGFGSLLVVYLIVGFAANQRPLALEHLVDEPRSSYTGSRSDLHEPYGGFSDVESYYTSSNPRLSREIDSLR
jgi:phage shock protein C